MHHQAADQEVRHLSCMFFSLFPREVTRSPLIITAVTWALDCGRNWASFALSRLFYPSLALAMNENSRSQNSRQKRISILSMTKQFTNSDYVANNICKMKASKTNFGSNPIPVAVPLVTTPQVPKESILVGATAELPKTTLPAAVPPKPNVGFTAEVEKSHQNQVGVIIIPQSLQPLPRTSTGSQPPSRPPIIHAYGASSSLGMFPDSHTVITPREWGFPCLQGQVTGKQPFVMASIIIIYL